MRGSRFRVPGLVLGLVLLFPGPTISQGAWGEEPHSILFDEFDSVGRLYSTPNWSCTCMAEWPAICRCISREGSALLAIAGADSGSLTTAWLRDVGWLSHWYEDIQLRVRCSDDNTMLGPLGGGTRIWGWFTGMATKIANALCFLSASPESGPFFEGFWALSISSGIVTMAEPLEHINTMEWHNYTVLWRPGNATFMVDGRRVAWTAQPPENPMAVYVGIDNRFLNGLPDNVGWGYLGVSGESWIELDRIQVTVDQERYTEIPNLLLRAQEILDRAQRMGAEIRDLTADLARAEEAWEAGHPGLAEMHLLRIVEREGIPEGCSLLLLGSLGLLVWPGLWPGLWPGFRQPKVPVICIPTP